MTKYFIDTDNDAHWYLVEASHRKEWGEWRDLPEDDPKSWEPPNFAEPLRSHPSIVEFIVPEKEETIRFSFNREYKCSHPGDRSGDYIPVDSPSSITPIVQDYVKHGKCNCSGDGSCYYCQLKAAMKV